MRLRTFDDGGRLRVSACRRYQGSMSTSLPADGCGRLYHNRLLRAVFRRKPLRPLRKRKDIAEGPRSRSRQARPSRRIAQLSVATSATLPAQRAAFGRDKRDPPGASRSFRSRQARPSRRIAQLSVATSATLPAQLSVATSATLPAHRAAFGRDRRDPPGASRSFRSRQARPSRRSTQLSVATSATLPAHRTAFGRDRRDPPDASRSVRSRQARPSRRIAQLPVATGATLPTHHTAPRRGRRGYFACRAVRAKPGNRPCGDQALATLIFAAWPLRSQEAASGHAANESAVASVSAFT